MSLFDDEPKYATFRVPIAKTAVTVKQCELTDECIEHIAESVVRKLKSGCDSVSGSGGDLISRSALLKEFAEFVRASNNSDFVRTPTWNDAVSLVGSMPSAQQCIPCETCERRCEKWEHSKTSRE